jgi:hypothetical protein
VLIFVLNERAVIWVAAGNLQEKYKKAGEGLGIKNFLRIFTRLF